MIKFQEFPLKKEIIQAVEKLGFTSPTPIQEKAIPYLLTTEGDFVGLAQTGTGKTAAFGLPLLHHIDPNNRNIQGLILCPTRELCIQIANELEKYAYFLKDVSIVPVYGGVNIQSQIKSLRSKPQIVVATPGRLIDLINRKAISIQNVKYLILDEADEMLNMGFKEDIDYILDHTPDNKKVWLFSATMPPEVERIAGQYMHDPEKVVIGKKNSSAENLDHFFAHVHAKDMYAALTRFLDYYQQPYAIVFCRTKRDTQEIADKLIKDGFPADALHGDLSQAQRDFVMKRFRNKVVKVLVATDVAARGIDIKDVSHVFHMGLPEDIENYTHRSGRTARAGQSGMSIAIIHSRDYSKLRRIEKMTGKKINLIKVPGEQEILQAGIDRFIQQIIQNPGLPSKYSGILQQCIEKLKDFSKEDIIAAVVANHLETMIKDKKIDQDLNVNVSRSNKSNTDHRIHSGNFGRSGTDLFLNIGSKDIDNKSKFLHFVCTESGCKGTSIGRINLKDTYSFITVDNKDTAMQIIRGLQGKTINNRTIKVEISQPKSSASNNPTSSGTKRKRLKSKERF